jgi:glutamine amidotransferase-like uncharacterized protein
MLSVFFAVLIFGDPSVALDRPLALIYNGPGVCAKGCAKAAAKVALLAGYSPRLVDQEGPTEREWKQAKLWIQPGGRVVDQEAQMPQQLKAEIIRFVEGGGGFVGFCAGAFLAMENFGWQSARGEHFLGTGLGLVRGQGRFYHPIKEIAAIVRLRDENHGFRYVYWELGPYLPAPNAGDSARALSWYDDGTKRYVASLIAAFGSGRVALTGHHPEAPNYWRKLYQLRDPDGLDYEEAKKLIRWAAGKGEGP